MTLIFKHKNILKLAIILSLFFGFFLGFNNGSVYAVDDVVVHYSTSTVAGDNIFPTCTDSNCLSQYKYFYISVNDTNARLSFSVRGFKNAASAVSIYVNSFYDLTGTESLKFNTSYTLNNIDYTFTLSNSLPGQESPSGSLSITENGTFDVLNYASVSVNVPQDVTEIVEDPISNDFQKVFFAIVEKIIPAFGILLVVWFGIDMLSSLIFGRGR